MRSEGFRNLYARMHEIAVVARSGDFSGALTLLARTVLRSRRPLRVRVHAMPVLVRPNTPDVAIADACFSGEFDAAIAAATPLQYRFIIDAGGYIGTSAMAMARAFPDARIVSLEPSRENFAILVENIRPWPNVTALNVALGAAKRVAALVDRGTGEAGFSTVQGPADSASPRPLHDVAVTTVPDLMREFGATGVDILKLDIEGAEAELLRGQPPWLRHVCVVLAEIHERIVPGSEAVFAHATAERRNRVDGAEEKVLSIRADRAEGERAG